MKIRETFLLTAEECQEVIKAAEDNDGTFCLRTMGDPNVLANGYILKRDTELAKKILKRISIFTNSPIENLENLLVMKSDQTNKCYKPHFDYIEELEGVNIEPGHRIKTCIVYLNDDFEGGETSFTEINKIIKPETGKAIYWFNSKENNTFKSELDEQSRHSSLPIKKGTKNILVVWIRENKADHLNLKYRLFKIDKHSNFLNKNECKDLISRHFEKIECLPIIDPKKYLKDRPLRTVDAKFLLADGQIQRSQLILEETDPIVSKIRKKFSELTETPLENQEPIILIKYDKDQGYLEHIDNFPNFDTHKCRRTHSLIIYLNECDGGETYFRFVNEKIKPETGLGIIWNNLRDGKVLPDTAHSSLPVKTGSKYILVLWTREVKYGGPV